MDVGGEARGLGADEKSAWAKGCGCWAGGEAQGALGKGAGEHGCGIELRSGMMV
jgi:hypothetical protein